MRSLVRTSAKMAMVMAGLSLLAASCGADKPDGISEQQGFVMWLAANDPLVTEHTQWHSGAAGTAGARTYPKSGAEFLRFHRSFLHRLREKFRSMNLPYDITPWHRLPAEMRSPSAGWTTALATAETNIYNNTDPANNG